MGGGDNVPQRPASGRAPWERGQARQKPTGNHSHGVTVADLIAKVNGTPPGSPAPVNPTPHRQHGFDESEITTPIPVVKPPPTASRANPAQPAVKAPPEKARRKLHTGRLAARAAAVLVAVSALTVTGAAWQWQSAKNKLMNTIAALDPNSSDIRDPNAQSGDENFLIIGVDSRIGANGEMGAGDTAVAEGARSDTIMLVNIPASRKRVVAVSFPRDLAITPMKCQAWNAETGKYGPVYDKTNDEWSDNERLTGTKLNSAYALGGPKCLVKVVQKISGLAINRFMAVDFAGFSTMVDALGGVEVCSTTPLEDAELGTVLSTAGRQTIDGTTALNYVRARSIASEGNGDYGRIKRQQLFLSSLMRSMISTETLFDIDRLDEVVNTFIDDTYVDNVKTRDLVQLGQSMQGINAGRITFVTLPTTGEADDEGNEVPRTQDIQALFDAIIDDKPLPGENDNNETLAPVTTTKSSRASSSESGTPTSTTETSSTASVESDESSSMTTTEEIKVVAADPRDITVQVGNATETKGLATAATHEFESFGFDVLDPDYTDWGTRSSTTIYYSLGNEQAAATIAATLPGASIKRITGLDETIQVVLGSDFKSVKYPQASGTPLTVSVTHAGTSTPTKLPSDLTVTNGADVTCE
jgi:LCP family protein required for cell wall assembly